MPPIADPNSTPPLCPNCGAALPAPKPEFCPNCGAALRAASTMAKRSGSNWHGAVGVWIDCLRRVRGVHGASFVRRGRFIGPVFVGRLVGLGVSARRRFVFRRRRVSLSLDEQQAEVSHNCKDSPRHPPAHPDASDGCPNRSPAPPDGSDTCPRRPLSPPNGSDSRPNGSPAHPSRPDTYPSRPDTYPNRPDGYSNRSPTFTYRRCGETGGKE